MNRSVQTLLTATALSLSSLCALTPTAAAAQALQPARTDAAPVTREQVRAELDAARASGALNPFDPEAVLRPEGQPTPSFLARWLDRTPSRPTQAEGLTREQVRAELDAARASGALNPFDPETVLRPEGPATPSFLARWLGAVPTKVAAGGLTREQVLADLDAARRAGWMNPFDNLADLSPIPRVIEPTAPSATVLAQQHR